MDKPEIDGLVNYRRQKNIVEKKGEFSKSNLIFLNNLKV